MAKNKGMGHTIMRMGLNIKVIGSKTSEMAEEFCIKIRKRSFMMVKFEFCRIFIIRGMGKRHV